jgi:hypothetical protein
MQPSPRFSSESNPMSTRGLGIPNIPLQSQGGRRSPPRAFDSLDQAIAGLPAVDISTAARSPRMPLTPWSVALRPTGTLVAYAEVVVTDNSKPSSPHNATASGFVVTVGTGAPPPRRRRSREGSPASACAGRARLGMRGRKEDR